MGVIYDGKTKKLVKEEKKFFLHFKDTVLGDIDHRVDPGGDFVVGRSPGKGKIATAAAANIFQVLKKSRVETHYVKKVSENEIEILPAERIDLEVIYRELAYGSFLRRYRGLVDPLSDLGVVEFTLKSDALGDPPITDAAIMKIEIADKKEIETMERKAKRVGEVLGIFLGRIGLKLVDLKVEFGKIGGELVIIDAIHGDTMRAIDKKTKKIISPIELDKRLARAQT